MSYSITNYVMGNFQEMTVKLKINFIGLNKNNSEFCNILTD